jgi:hypothetical protein
VIAQSSLALQCVGRGIAIHCEDGPTRDVLRELFDVMWTETASPQLQYRIAATDAGYCLSRSDVGPVGNARDLGQLLYVLDCDLVIQLQRLRPDLLFLHAAVLTYEGAAHVLTGRSGAGKSTTCWGLLHRGLGYLSDELAPIRLPDMTVQPFPRALCMKTAPPPGFELPPGTPATSRGYHVAISHMPASPPPVPSPLQTVFFVEYDASRRAPTIRAIGSAEAAARLYPNLLNALAHDDAAMAGVTRIATATRAFLVEAAELGATCETILGALRH